MAAIVPFPFASPGYASNAKSSFSAAAVPRDGAVGFLRRKIRMGAPSYISPKIAIRCAAAAQNNMYIPPTVSETKLKFLKAYKCPIPSIYNTFLQELIVLQHLMRYKRTYRYDAVFALGFVTIFEQLMEGYPTNEDPEQIFRAYIQALNEDPELYRSDARKLEEWACVQNASSLLEFASEDGDVANLLTDIAGRAGSKENFSYSRFFAVGLFRLLEIANAVEPGILDKLCAALNIDKRSVSRDLDVYRNHLSKLVQAKEFLMEYVDNTSEHLVLHPRKTLAVNFFKEQPWSGGDALSS